MNLFEISFLFFSFLGFLLAILIFLKKSGDKIANVILSGYLILFAYNIGFNTLFWSKLLYTEGFVHLFGTNAYTWLSYGPFFYLYVRRVVDNTSFKWYDLLLFIPSIIYFTGKFSFYVLSAEVKLASIADGSFRDYGLNTLDVAYFAMVYMAFCGFLAIRFLLQRNIMDFNKAIWFKFFIGAFVGYWLAFMVYFLRIPLGLYSVFSDYIICYCIILFIGAVAYFGFVQPEVFNGLPIKKIVPFIKYEKTGLSKEFSLEMKDKLLIVMEKKKPYLDSEIRLDTIAEMLNISRHHASQVINEHFSSHFFDFINEYRVKEAEALLKNSNSTNLSITDIAYQVGFNNRISFYKAFKKNFGTTPTSYKEKGSA